MKQIFKNKKVMIGLASGVIILILALVLFFNFSTPKYTVRFDTTGGDTIAPVKVKENEKVSAPKDPTKENAEFIGWYLDGQKFDFNSKITKNITLEAKWKTDSKIIMEAI